MIPYRLFASCKFCFLLASEALSLSPLHFTATIPFFSKKAVLYHLLLLLQFPFPSKKQYQPSFSYCYNSLFLQKSSTIPPSPTATIPIPFKKAVLYHLLLLPQFPFPSKRQYYTPFSYCHNSHFLQKGSTIPHSPTATIPISFKKAVPALILLLLQWRLSLRHNKRDVDFSMFKKINVSFSCG